MPDENFDQVSEASVPPQALASRGHHISPGVDHTNARGISTRNLWGRSCWQGRLRPAQRSLIKTRYVWYVVYVWQDTRSGWKNCRMKHNKLLCAPKSPWGPVKNFRYNMVSYICAISSKATSLQEIQYFNSSGFELQSSAVQIWYVL